MSGKRRFGVSIPVELADDLDRLAGAIGGDRSSIVAEALRTYIHDHLYYIYRHRCLGVLIAVSQLGFKRVKRGVLIDEFRDIVKSYTHQHVGNNCIEIFIVEGDSNRIAELHSRLIEQTTCVRYIPLGTQLYKEENTESNVE